MSFWHTIRPSAASSQPKGLLLYSNEMTTSVMFVMTTSVMTISVMTTSDMTTSVMTTSVMTEGVRGFFFDALGMPPGKEGLEVAELDEGVV